MKPKNLITKPCFLITISAVLSALPLTFGDLFLLSWISFVPLFYVVITHSCESFKRCIGRGFLFGFIYHLFIYYWFIWFYPLDFAGFSNGGSVAVVLLASVGISLVHGALWCIPTIICHLVAKLSKNPFVLSLAGVIGIMFAQKLTAVGELTFPWARISLGQYKVPALIQGASFFGIDGVDMLILTVNALIAICIIYPFKKRLITAGIAVVVFAANLGFGLIRINQNTLETDRTINIMTVQASVKQNEKWSSSGDKICQKIYSSLTKENYTENVDLVLWPESAVPKVYKSEKSLKSYVNLAKELDVNLIAGILLESGEANTNNAILITPEGVADSYAKRQLVPFGEYLPYEETLVKILPFLSYVSVFEDEYIPGKSSAIMSFNEGKIGNIICFESIYPEVTRKSVLDGAELLIEVTNDSWLKDSPAMTQHLAHGVFRSVENGKSLVRSANSGISAFIDPYGRIKNQLGIDKQGTLAETVSFNDQTTFYTKNGDVLFPISVAFLFVLCIVLAIKNQNKKGPQE